MSYHGPISRRRFLGQVAAGALGVATLPSLVQAGARRSATDRVLLGKSGVTVSRLGMGTGTNSGNVQRSLGQSEFTRLVRHGIDRGISFFDTADNYGEMHEMLREALKGVDRSTIQIQCKIPGYDRYPDPLSEIDRFRKEVGTDYFDTFLMHHMRTPDWPTENARLMDVLGEARHRGWIRAHGVSIHGYKPLEAGTKVDWMDVALLRVNHDGSHMDIPNTMKVEDAHANVLKNIEAIHKMGTGVVGMKLIGNGDFTDPERRERSIRMVMGLNFVDAVVIGFKSPAEIDEAIQRIDRALNV